MPMPATRPQSLRHESAVHANLRSREVDDSDGEFLDASESIIYGESLDLHDTISETQITLNLFMNNKFELAEERMQGLADKSMYHALGYSTIIFIKAMMTCDRKDMEVAVRAAKDAAAVIEKYRPKSSFADSLYRLGGGAQKRLTDEELHAELCYADSLLFRAVLSFFQDESLASFVRGALKIRSCFQTYRECQRLLQTPSVWEGRDERVKRQFESGTRMGIGTFNLMLSTLPSKVLRLLEVVGFSGDKLHACAAMSDTLRAPLCCMTLLGWHLLASFIFGSGQPDLRLCENLLQPLVEKYPQGAIILFYRARYLLVRGDLDRAIYFFNKSIAVQNVYKQFHHVCYWELLFAHSYLLEWNKSAYFAKLLMDESRWSRCIYTYMLACFIAADETTNEERRKETVMILAKKVDGYRLRIAGKSIPMEKFCSRKVARFFRTGSLIFAHYELMYFWNGFHILEGNTIVIQSILRDIDRAWEKNSTRVDRNDECLYWFLRALCLRSLQSPFQAEEALKRVISSESELNDHFYLVPNAVFELSQVRLSQGRLEEAEALLNKARNYKGYSMENKLHFRIHAAMERLGAKTPLP